MIETITYCDWCNGKRDITRVVIGEKVYDFCAECKQSLDTALEGKGRNVNPPKASGYGTARSYPASVVNTPDLYKSKKPLNDLLPFLKNPPEWFTKELADLGLKLVQCEQTMDTLIPSPFIDEGYKEKRLG